MTKLVASVEFALAKLSRSALTLLHNVGFVSNVLFVLEDLSILLMIKH